MSTVISPSIGRRVWYWPNASDLNAGMQFNGTQPCDAGICYVWSDHLVNLTVADHNGHMHRRTSVRLLQGGATANPGEAVAAWMPYQQGQARAQADVGSVSTGA